MLRSWSYGEHNYARVEGDEIIHEGRAVSPNQFARHFARTARNAWFDLSVRRPGDKQFKMAGLLRKELARQSQQPALPAPAPAATAPPPTVPTELAECAQPDRAEPVKKADFEGGWDLPERRKFRYRLEDVAY